MKRPGGISASTRQPLDIAPAPKDRRVLSIMVRCGVCQSPVGVVCVSAEGKPQATPHRERRRMALRLERGES